MKDDSSVNIELAQEYAGAVKLVKLNIDENTNIAQECEVKSIPTLMIFRNGTVQKKGWGRGK